MTRVRPSWWPLGACILAGLLACGCELIVRSDGGRQLAEPEQGAGGTAATCGDGLLDTREGCDDGNTESRDGCSATCLREVLKWKPVATTAPPARWGAGIVATGTEVILFGGFNVMDNISYGDSWAFDGTSWRELEPAAPPTRRASMAMAYDSARDVVVMFGGNTLSTIFDQTWERSTSGWSRINTPNAPSVRWGAKMVYDSLRQQMVLFGGRLVNTQFNDTWRYDGTNWTRVDTTTAPSARAYFGMVYDSARDRVVLFGGCANTECTPPHHADVWELGGTGWQEVQPSVQPVARNSPGFTYDEPHARTVMWGGVADGVDTTDHTVEYDGTDWNILTPEDSPTAGASRPHFVYASWLGLSVLYRGAEADTWLYGYQ